MGLDPNAARIAQELADAQKTQPLEPPFPFTSLMFNASFFGVDGDPTLPNGQPAYLPPTGPPPPPV